MFWGLILEPHRCYSQKVERSFHISQAALDIFAASDEPSQIMLTFQKRNYLLCTLQKGQNIQCNLDLNFEAGELVSFATNGASNVHLTGYLNEDLDEDEDLDEEEEEDETEIVEQDTASNKRKKGQSTSDVPVKKSKTIQLLEEAANSYNSDDDPTFNFSQEDDDLEDEEDSDDEDNAEFSGEDDSDEDDDEDDADSLDDDQINSSNDNVFSATNGISKKKRNLRSINVSEVSEPAQKQKNKTPLKQELNDRSPKTPKVDMKTNKNENKTPKNNKTPGKNDKTPNAKNETLKQNNSNANSQQAQSPKKRIVEGGLIIQDLKEGEGKPVKDGKMVQVYYEGRLKSNNKVFDSTKQGAGFKFRVGKREVIKGWDVGLVGMKVGGKRRLTCPPSMAYGQKGSPPVIPGNSTLVFDVELKKIQ